MVQYVPTGFPPSDPDDFRQWAFQELKTMARLLNGAPNFNKLILAELNEAPSKVITGMTCLADGTNWDPGSGQGVYTYYNSAWNKLG